MTALQTVIDKNATLTDGSRAAGDYDNSSAQDNEGIAYLELQFDTGPPSAGAVIASMWLLPGDGEVSESFPEGGDGTVGTDDDPQPSFLIAVFTTINPSTSVNEVAGSLPFYLYPATNRFVIRNDSGQTYDATWELRIKPYRR